MDEITMLEDLKSLVMNDIYAVVDKGTIASNEYEVLGEAVDILKDIKTIEAMMESGDASDISNRSMPTYRHTVTDNRARTQQTGMDVAKPKMVSLEDLLAKAQTEPERQMIQRMMNEM